MRDDVAEPHRRSPAAVHFGCFGDLVERIQGHQDVAEEFVTTLCEMVATHVTGDAHEDRTVLGPLVDERQRDIAHRHVTDAATRPSTVHVAAP